MATPTLTKADRKRLRKIVQAHAAATKRTLDRGRITPDARAKLAKELGEDANLLTKLIEKAPADNPTDEG